MQESLDRLREVEKDLAKDNWMYEAPQHAGEVCSTYMAASATPLNSQLDAHR